MARVATLIPLALALKQGKIDEKSLDPTMLKKIKALGPLVMGGSPAPPGSPMTPSRKGRRTYSPVRSTHVA